MQHFIAPIGKGVKEAMDTGVVAGFPVQDVRVRLFDGQYHSVDSSDAAFRTAARIAMTEGLPQCEPVLLEPIHDVQIFVPSDFTSKIQRAVKWMQSLRENIGPDIDIGVDFHAKTSPSVAARAESMRVRRITSPEFLPVKTQATPDQQKRPRNFPWPFA